MLNPAIELLEYGLSVIPIVKKTKLPPAGCTWKGQQDRLPDEDLVIQRFTDHPDCNIGIITGPGSGVVVIDGDSQEACTWVEKAFPHTWLTVSNSGRGKHYYYRYPEDAEIKTSSNILYKDVDVRGNKGLVVVPPSTHKSENKYIWQVDEGYSLSDLDELPVCPVDVPGILGFTDNGDKKQHEDIGNNHIAGELKNIALQCEWLRHCKADADNLGYDEWRWMLSIVSRCRDGRAKAHKLSALSSQYDYETCDRKITEVLNNMGAISCRTISGKFKNCFQCDHLGKGLTFSPVILGAEEELSVRNERITIEDIEKQEIGDLTLSLPEKIINPQRGGELISMGMAALRNSEAPEIPQYSFPIVASVISRALMNTVTYAGVWPNFYFVKVGGTSTGKTDSDKIMRRSICFDEYFKDFYGPDDFSSGPGLLRGLESQPQTLVNLDEISYLFKRLDRPDPVTSGKIEVLLQLFTNCGITYRKPYGDNKKSIVIVAPCLSLIGNATPGIFNDIKPEDFISGLIQRFTFFSYDGDIHRRKQYIDGQNQDMDIFLKMIKKIYKENDDGGDTLVDIIKSPVEMVASVAARKMLAEFSEHIRTTANKKDDQGHVGIISRKYYESIKYAMLYNAGEGFELSRNAIEYGIDLANLLGDWKLDILSGKIREGVFHRDCEIFKDGIVAVLKKGQIPTGKMIADRRARIKALKPYEIDNIITALCARKEIEIDETGRSTAYYLIKKRLDFV